MAHGTFNSVVFGTAHHLLLQRYSQSEKGWPDILSFQINKNGVCTSVLFWRISEKSAALFLESKMKEGGVNDNGDSESAAIDWVEVMGYEQEYVTSVKPFGRL